MRRLLIILLFFVISGCASAHHTRLSKEPMPQLDEKSSAYILVPSNAMYFTKECINSGRAVVNLIYGSFSKYLNKTEIAPEGVGFDEGLRIARDSGFTYLINSRITTWEDYATEWNGRLDRIDLQMDIFDTKSNKILDSVNFKGNGTWFTFGGYRPTHILKRELPDYVATLFMGQEK